MQRVARQAVYAERRALLKREKIEKAKKRKYDKENKMYRMSWRTAVGRLKRDAMGSLKTDIELGELAPRRDIGLEAEKFATLPEILTYKPSAHHNVFERLYKKRHQSSTELFRSYKVDDKVIIVNGLGEGRTGFIEEVFWETQKVKLSGMFLADVWKPDWQFEAAHATDRKNNIQTNELLIDMHNIRLLQRISGRDVIVDRFQVDGWEPKEEDEVVTATRRRTAYEGDEKRSEVVPRIRHLKGILLDEASHGVDKDFDEEYLETVKRKKAYPADSVESEVGLRTLVPDLQREPFPASVIDEMRSPFGKYRTRHDEEYMKYMIEKDEKKVIRKKAVSLMELPTPGMYGKKPGNSPAPQLPPLDVLKMLGEAMMKNQGEKAVHRGIDEDVDDPQRLLTREQKAALRLEAFEQEERSKLLTGKLLAKWNIGPKPKNADDSTSSP